MRNTDGTLLALGLAGALGLAAVVGGRRRGSAAHPRLRQVDRGGITAGQIGDASPAVFQALVVYDDTRDPRAAIESLGQVSAADRRVFDALLGDAIIDYNERYAEAQAARRQAARRGSRPPRFQGTQQQLRAADYWEDRILSRDLPDDF